MSKLDKRNNEIHAELRRIITNYNKRVQTIIKKYPSLIFSFPEYNYKDLKEVVISKKDLDRIKNQTDKIRINNPKIKPYKDIDFLSPQLYKNFKSLAKSYNLRKELRESLNMNYRNSGFSLAQMGFKDFENVKIKTDISRFKTGKDIAKLSSTLLYRLTQGYATVKDELYKENFLKSLEGLPTLAYDKDNNLVKVDLHEIISEMETKEFIKIVKASGEDLHLLLNDNYTISQSIERVTELVQILGISL